MSEASVSSPRRNGRSGARADIIGLPIFLLMPKHRFYKGKGWLSWGDFLGYKPGYGVEEWR